MKKKNPLGLRVLSTAAVMSIITSIAAPAFAGTYYMDNGDLTVRMDEEGKVYVKSGNEEKLDEDGEVTIKGGSGTNTWSNKSSTNAEKQKAEEPQEEPSIGESYPVEEKTEEEPAAEQPEPEEETKEQTEEPENPAEDEQPKPEAPAAEEKTPAEDAAEPEETPDEDTEETDDTEESEEEDAGPAAEEEDPVEEDEVPKTTEEAAAAPTKREIAKAPVKPQPEAVTLEAAGEGTAVQDEEETTEEETPTKNVIKVVNNAVDKVLKIILDNVHIDVSGNKVYNEGKAAMEVKGSGDVTLELNGENVLKSDTNRAGLEKNDQYVNGQKVSGTLTIQDEDQDGGSLEAVGNGNAAGIGSSGGYTTSNISITGGKITAKGGFYGGAGIGSGENYNTTAATADNIHITGGKINAESTGNGGAGIGSGRAGNVGTITIGGNAVVTAKGAPSVYGGAGIGAGMCETDFYRNIGGDVDTITIEGNATIQEAVGGVDSAGIGAGGNGKIRLITIKDNASVVKAENNGSNGGGGAGIGGGGNWSRDGAGSATIDINTTGTVNATGRGGGAGIGGGGYGSSDKTGGTGTVTISNGTVNAVSEGGGAAIGGGGGKDGGAGIVTISGGTITADAKDSYCQTGAGIGGGAGNVVGGAGRVTITDGEITLAKSAGSAGIGDGYSVSPSTVVGENTSGNGFVKITGGTIGKFEEIAKCVWKLVEGTGAIGGRSSAGIGGARVESDGKAEATKGHVTISGSPFIGAVGGKYAFGTESAAAIGNGVIGYESDKSDTMDVTALDTTKVSVTKPRGEDANETWIVPTHTWNEGEVTKAPTCTEKGEKTFTCTNCNATKTEEIPVDPKAHNYTREEGEKEWDEIIPATCTTAGKKVKHCKNAPNDKTHDLVETIAIDKDAHNWGEWTTTKKATCTADGEQERVCKNDPTHKETQKIDATGHQHTKIVGKKDATETEPGYTGDKVCDKCGEIIEKGEVIPAKGHTWVKGEHHDANCMKGGYDDYTCSGCGATKEEPDGTTPNNDHDYSGEEWDEITNATCTTDGKKVKHCKRPGADATHDKTEVIPATGHEKTHIEGKKEPTCEEPGYTGDKVCDKCGDVVEKGEVIPAKGHTPTVVGRKDPTETEPGYTGDTVCADCGKLLEKGEVIPATGKKDAENAEALELRVVVPGNTLRDLLFTVRQADGERTYTCKKADATLTGTLETLQYLQANGAETIVFVTNGRVSRFAVADLLALCNEGDVFYLCHTADAEPTLLIIANDHTELLNK